MVFKAIGNDISNAWNSEKKKVAGRYSENKKSFKKEVGRPKKATAKVTSKASGKIKGFFK